MILTCLLGTLEWIGVSLLVLNEITLSMKDLVTGGIGALYLDDLRHLTLLATCHGMSDAITK